MRRLLLPLLATILLALAPAATVPAGALPAPFSIGARMAHASTLVLPATQVTVPAGDAYYPGQNGGALPAGLVSFTLNVDTSQMPTGNSFWAYVELQYTGDPTWHDFVGTFMTGGSHPARGGGTTTTEAIQGTLPQSPYPSAYRIHTAQANAPSPVTVSGLAD